MKVPKGFAHAIKTIIGSGLASAALLASNVVLARNLPAGIYGDYATASTLINGGMFVATFGITQLLLQEFGRKRGFTANFAQGAQTLQAASTIISCIAIVAIANALHLSTDAKSLTTLLLPMLVAQAVGEIASTYFQFSEQLWLSGGWVAILNLLRMGCVFIFVSGTRDIRVLAYMQVIVAIVFSAASIFLIFKMFSDYTVSNQTLRGRGFLSSLKCVFIFSSPYAIANVMFYAISQLPIVIFSAVAGSKQAAAYSVAYLVLSTMYFVPQTLMVRYLMLKYHALVSTDRRNVGVLYRRGTVWAIAAGVTLIIPGYLLAPFAVTHVFGNKYSESIKLLEIMMICVPLRFVTVNLAALVVSGVSIWHKNFADLVGGAFAIGCFSILIWHYGATGGAYAAVLTECVTLFLHLYLVERFFYGRGILYILRLARRR